jgi:serine phosphatase RsbU (regulator of sigma subunit)/pSer/pThr/pTyr-binding forkhead associated (FHA) protein
MPQLIVTGPSGTPEFLPLQRIKTTIGRSARSDVCIPDAFASRLHAEVRQEGDGFWLHDLGSANGTRYNGSVVKSPVPINSGGEIQIGETRIVFDDERAKLSASSMLIADNTEALDPSKTIAFSLRKSPTTEFLSGQFSSRTDLLELISKVGVALLSAKSLDDTLDQVASLVFEAVPAERVVIMLRANDDPEEMQIKVARLRGKSEPIEEVRISRTVMDEVLKNGKSVLTADAQHDPKFFSQTMALQGIRSVLAVPLSVDERTIFGLIYADSPTYEATFTEEHLNILTTLASVASIRVENASLLDERLIRERMERELELATEIQQRFQPSAPPIVTGYEFQGISFSCYEIGGDYYDFVPRHDGKMLVALGDVSGKGTAAALLMSSVHAAIHAQVAAKTVLDEAISSVNRYLAENTPANRFVTLFAGELDPANGRFKYINAGHNPPLIAKHDGSVQQLSSGGLPLGIIADTEFETGEITLEPGESLVIYSDGVNEANNLAGDEFGMDRLIQVVGNNLQASASGMRDKIESALSEFTQTAPANDDITLVIVKRI